MLLIMLTLKFDGVCKEDITPLPMHWSCIFLALTHRIDPEGSGGTRLPLAKMDGQRSRLICSAMLPEKCSAPLTMAKNLHQHKPNDFPHNLKHNTQSRRDDPWLCLNKRKDKYV